MAASLKPNIRPILAKNTQLNQSPVGKFSRLAYIGNELKGGEDLDANSVWDITQGAVNFIVFLAGGIYAVEKLSVPIKKLMKIGQKNQSEEQRLQSLEGWTGNQQNDLDNLNEGVVILAGAVEALLDHAIQKQEGNGKCHKAQEEVEVYLKEKALSKKSHK